MRAITVRQPHAWAILHAGKDVENRTRSTRYRGPLLVHAGRAEPSHDEMARVGATGPLATGVFVAVAALVDVHQCDGGCSRWARPGRWHLVLADPRPVPPVPARGWLGLWPVAPETMTQLGL